MKTIKMIGITFILLQMLDVITTIIGLHLGFIEANSLLPILGWANLNFLKILFTILVPLGFIMGYKLMPRYFTVVGVVTVFITAAPVANNIIQLLSIV